MERVHEQRRLVDKLNERHAPFRVLHGAEVNIVPDGRLHYPDDELDKLDLVTAAVHSHFDPPVERMTARVVTALARRAVTCLGQPTGRLLQQPDSYMEAVPAAAQEPGVGLEINGQPDRLDLNDVWSRPAQDAGIVLVCNSDAHSTRQLANLRYSIATARRGWAEPADVLNTFPLKDLLGRLTARRRAK